VSMLSTKYRTGKINYVQAILDGINSNISARKNHQNYSSIIYIFKKN